MLYKIFSLGFEISSQKQKSHWNFKNPVGCFLPMGIFKSPIDFFQYYQIGMGYIYPILTSELIQPYHWDESVSGLRYFR